MLRALLAILFVILLFSACTQRMICPAYQSAFIYDRDELRKKFSYFQEDSTPKIYTASKTKYLIAEPVSYKKKIRSMQTVKLKEVYVSVPDSFQINKDSLLMEPGEDGVNPGSALDMAARSVMDSTFIVDTPPAEEAPAEDSVYVISKDRELRMLKYDFPDSLILDENTGRYVPEKPRYAVVHITFNVEQDNYMWYLRDYLVLPDVRQARIQQGARDEEEKQATTKKKKQKGFFRNLFKKKNKNKAEEPVEEAAPEQKTNEEEFDFIDEDEEVETNATQVTQPEAKEKKGLFRKKKPTTETTPPAEVKEEETPTKDRKKKPEATPPPADTEEKVNTEPLDEDGF